MTNDADNTHLRSPQARSGILSSSSRSITWTS